MLLVAVTVALFWPVNRFDFLVYDDRGYVTENVHVVSGLTAENMAWAFRTTEKANWHPLTWLSYMLDCQLFGVNARLFHLINLCFHAANSFLLFWFWKQTTGALWQSAFVAALFAWHPLHVESVAWIAERKDMLSTFFWLLTLIAYAKYVERPNSGRYGLCVALFALGLMTKPMLVTLPFVLLLLDLWPLGRFRLPGWSIDPASAKAISAPQGADREGAVWKGPASVRAVWGRRLLIEKAPFFLLGGFSSFMTFFAQKSGGAVRDIDDLSVGIRLGNALLSYSRYIGKMIWPINLAVPYPYPSEFRPWPLIGAGLMLALVSTAVTFQARRRPYLMIGWLWYLGTLVPVIGLIQVGLQSMADRYTYVPLIGLFVMISWGLSELAPTFRYRAPLLASFAVVTLLGCLVFTRFQLPYWKNSETLFEHTLKVTPRNAIAHHNLGAFLVEEGKLDQAIEHLSKALENGSFLAGTHHDLGLALMGRGRTQEALDHFRQAAQIDPASPGLQRELGLALVSQEKFEEAESQLTSAVQMIPNDAMLHFALAEALSNRGKMQDAIGHYHEALRLSPRSPTVLNNLAWLLATCADAKFRNGVEAVRLAEQACELDSQKEPLMVGTLAAAYAEAGQFPKAIQAVEKARAMALSAGKLDLAARNQKLLELYRSGRAFHEDGSFKEAVPPAN